MMTQKSIPHLFEESVEKYPDNVLLWEKRGQEYRGSTYQEVYDRVQVYASGLLDAGLEKGDRVALISEGRNDWVVSELAILSCGCVCVPLSVKIEEPSDLRFRLQHSGCKAIVISGLHKHKALRLANELPDLSFIILLDAPDEEEVPATDLTVKPDVIILDDMLEKGRLYMEENNGVLDKIKEGLSHDDHANICYTSGTTADPKGIILTHLNYLCNVEQASAIFEVPAYYTSLHILPWDHSFAHTVGIYALMRNGASLASLKIGKTLNETLKNIPICINEVKPYFLLSVPALAKNFRNNIEKGVRDKGAIAKALFSAGLRVAYAYNREGHNKGTGWRKLLKPLYGLFDTILFKKVRAGFGGRLKFFVGGGALLDIELQRFFYAVGIPMYQGYGLTEAAPVISSNTPNFNKMGSSGKVVPYLDLKICNAEGQELPIGEQGEIVVKGDNVMAGYWNNPRATAETLRDGWLYTGDLGFLDEDGYLYVLGRTKSLLIGGDGEKYSPEGIEETMMQKSDMFDQVMLYNNQNTYTSAIIVLNKTIVREYIRKHNLDVSVEKGQRAVIQRLKSEIERYTPGGDMGGEFPARWLPTAAIFTVDAFSEQNKLMNSTMKIVRPAIIKHFADDIAFMYTPAGKDFFNERNLACVAKLGSA